MGLISACQSFATAIRGVYDPAQTAGQSKFTRAETVPLSTKGLSPCRLSHMQDRLFKNVPLAAENPNPNRAPIASHQPFDSPSRRNSRTQADFSGGMIDGCGKEETNANQTSGDCSAGGVVGVGLGARLCAK
jgi:hypothetical protein